MKQRTGTVIRNRSGTWRARLLVGSERRAIGSFKTEAEARAAIEKVRNKLRKHGPNRTIYFMQLAPGVVKIGIALDVVKRMTVAQTHCVHDVVVLATEPGDFVKESELHAQFSDLRIRGELYRLESPILSYIERLNSRNDKADSRPRVFENSAPPG